LSNDEDALDATQEAMIAIARGLGRFDGRSAFSTWCFRVATNSALDELRRRRRRPVVVPDRLRDDGDPLLGDANPGQDREAGRITDRIAVEEALLRLPEDQRVAVVLRDIADLDYAAIGDVLDVPIGTVRSRIFRGREALAVLLSDRGSSETAVARTKRNAGPDSAVKAVDAPPMTEPASP
jgi:RNA polymerase sigma-70 factor (ECF subfamily)